MSSVEKAYSQCMEALVAEALLRHTDVDVQVAVATCINEFLRITAPVAPYDDDKMKVCTYTHFLCYSIFYTSLILRSLYLLFSGSIPADCIIV